MEVEKEEVGALRVLELAKQLCEPREPLCPQFRLHHSERFYPVQGSCVLGGWPGWFMIPSIEEYREYCTTSQFCHCCWFSGATGPRGPNQGLPEGPATDSEAWRPPEVRGTLAA